MKSVEFIDIVFEGETFSPKQFSIETGLRLEIIAEVGELGKKGRYKGKPMPYGLALLKINQTNFEPLPVALIRTLDELLTFKNQIKTSGITEITLDLEAIDEAETDFFLAKDVVKKISELNANVEFSKIREEGFLVAEHADIFDFTPIKDLNKRLNELNDEMNTKIMQKLQIQSEIEHSRLIAEFKTEPGILEQHLRALYDAQFVNLRRKGKKIFYSANRGYLIELHNFFNNFTVSPTSKKAKKIG